jgi:hypothetical protein
VITDEVTTATTSPRKSLSAGCVKLRAMGRRFQGWCPAQRERVASQLHLIRHWQIIEGDYTAAPHVTATWFVDPPYVAMGHHYIHSQVDYSALGTWCRERGGQVIVCEASGADWLPFRPFWVVKAGPARGMSQEAIWTTGEPAPLGHLASGTP